jgi:hypothetical protein
LREIAETAQLALGTRAPRAGSRRVRRVRGDDDDVFSVCGVGPESDRRIPSDKPIIGPVCDSRLSSSSGALTSPPRRSPNSASVFSRMRSSSSSGASTARCPSARRPPGATCSPRDGHWGVPRGHPQRTGERGGGRHALHRSTAVRFFSCRGIDYENRSAHRLERRDTSAHAARTRVHRPRRRYASLAVASLLHRALLERASTRALASARVVRAALRAASMLRLSARRASAFHSSRARSSVAVAARPGRAALSESYARAGLTARRARRPGGGARPPVRSAQLEFRRRKPRSREAFGVECSRRARAHPSFNRRIAP